MIQFPALKRRAKVTRRYAATDAQASPDSNLRELRDDRRVIRWPLPAARPLVNPRAFAAACERLGDPDVVNAQARVAPESPLAVIPPGELAALRVVQAEGVLEAPPPDPLNRLALRPAEKNVAAPQFRVVHVPVFRRDVEVAAQKKLVVRPELLFEKGAQALQPFELEAVLVRADRLPVRHVDVDHLHPLYPRRDEPRVRAPLVSRHPAPHVLYVLAREDGDAVVGRLPVDRRRVAEFGELRRGEALLRALQLLHAEHVGAGLPKPAPDYFQASQHRVHVPRRDDHRCPHHSSGLREFVGGLARRVINLTSAETNRRESDGGYEGG